MKGAAVVFFRILDFLCIINKKYVKGNHISCYFCVWMLVVLFLILAQELAKHRVKEKVYMASVKRPGVYLFFFFGFLHC